MADVVQKTCFKLAWCMGTVPAGRLVRGGSNPPAPVATQVAQGRTTCNTSKVGGRHIKLGKGHRGTLLLTPGGLSVAALTVLFSRFTPVECYSVTFNRGEAREG